MCTSKVDALGHFVSRELRSTENVKLRVDPRLRDRIIDYPQLYS